MEMIRDDGIHAVTARSLGSRVGMNSALIYRYFKDIDEVILFACVHVLQEYTRDMLASVSAYDSGSEELSATDMYILSWQLFSKHAFNNPEEYNTLFFSKHSSDLESVIKEYYDLFPSESKPGSDVILEAMFRTANLRNRNLMLLIPVLEQKRTEREIILINDMTVAFFYTLLSELTHNGLGCTAELQAERMLEACRFSAGI